MNASPWRTPPEAAKYLRIDCKWAGEMVQRLFRKKKIKFVRCGKFYLTKDEWLDDFLMRKGGSNA